MTRPLLVLVVVLGLALSGCGGGGAADGPAATPTASPGQTPGQSPDGSPDGSTAGSTAGSASGATGYFVDHDTETVNEVASPAQQALTRAGSTASQNRCARVGNRRGYDEWRSCWHGLLDPLQSSLRSMAALLGDVSAKDLPPACVDELTSTQRRFERLADRTAGLLTGIDSPRRRAQVRAMNAYGTVLGQIGTAFTESFPAMTAVCYSPEDLAGINASPQGSPSASP